MTWRTEIGGVDSQREAYLTVANPSVSPIVVRVIVSLSGGRTRRERVTVPVGETWGARLRGLLGSDASDPTVSVTGLSVMCDGGSVACPVAWTYLAAPICEVQP